ncbi:SAYSvFN domain-containing protein 1-like isoform X1 [Branchiostoma floridae x Branchiostoma japonicum]
MATGADIHGKLAEYRARKAREYREETQKRNFWGNVGYVQGGTQEQEVNRNSRLRVPHQITRILGQNTSLLTNPTFLKFVLWLILLGFFIEMGFAAVYIVLSIFYVMYVNMRSGGRGPGELSAYSVFNPNCERLQGTLTAEQFERELKYKKLDD